MPAAKRPAAKKPAAKKKPAARKRAAAKKPKPLNECGARVVSVFGPFGSQTLVVMRTELATELFEGPLANSARTDVIDAALADIEDLRQRSPKLADSTLAAGIVAMAYEIAHPGNSATSKSMCFARMTEALDMLRDLAPPKPEEDELDRARARRAARVSGKPTAQDPSPS